MTFRVELLNLLIYQRVFILDPLQSNVALENPQQTTMYKGFSGRPRLISKGYMCMYLLKNELRMNYPPQMLV